MVIDRDTNGDGQPEGPQGYAKWSAIVSAHRNAALVTKADAFHQAYDNLSLADPSVQYARIIGDSLATPDHIREYTSCFLGRFNCQTAYDVVYADGGEGGDGTVPLHSADLYNPTTGFDFRGGFANVYAHDVEHAPLATDANVLSYAKSYFGVAAAPQTASIAESSVAAYSVTESSPRQSHNPWNTAAVTGNQMMMLDQSAQTSEAVSSATAFGLSDTPEPFSGIELLANGPVHGFVTDASGNMLGTDVDVSSSVITRTIPLGQYNAIAQTQSFFLNIDGAYQGQLKVASADPVLLRVRTYADNQLNGQAVFGVDSPVGAQLHIAFATGQDLASLRLQIDDDGDGVIEREVAPTSVVTGSAASDTTPPTTSAAV